MTDKIKIFVEIIIQVMQFCHIQSFYLYFITKYTLEMQMHQMSYGRNDSLMSDDQSEKLQLFVSCRKLADLDLITVTDSFLIVRMMEPNKPLRQILRTKVYENDLNPNYAETVIIDYFFQIRQKLVFQVYHFDKPPKLVGKAEATVGQIFGSPSNGLKKPLLNRNGKNSGQIIVRFQKVMKLSNQIISMNISARNLPESSSFLCFWGKIDPFFRIFRKRENEDLLVYESEVVQNTSDPYFKPVTISQRKLCRNNEQMPFQIRFFDYNGSGHHRLLGSATVTICQLQNGNNFEIMNKSKRSGICVINNMKRVTKYQFGDYISAGLQLALITCIDFTGSNGIPREPSSLHYIAPKKMSQYEEALYEVSKILLDYDYDKLVPVYGFGAKVNMPTYNTYGKVHHCFPLNGNQQNSNVFQVDGIMASYRNALPYLEFSGPTMFSKLLSNAIQQARQCQRDNNQYLILFILTDGQIHDKNEVIDQIVECCSLPISLIIVGIGNGDFNIMHQLDDDDCQMVDSKGRKTTRDLVQFVEFKNFKNNSIELAKEVLEQLPRQVEEYFQLMKITPQQLANTKVNMDIQNIAMNFQRQPGLQPVYANMDGSLQRQGTWEQAYHKKNTFEVPPPPNFGNNNFRQ